jgi:hydrogenase expression/formation protein HypE
MKLDCPLPHDPKDSVQMAHGGGGRKMQRLIQEEFLAAFSGPDHTPHDAAVLDLASGRIAFTTDSYVVSPMEFPGGNIGKLAIYGTVNDLAMAGARPHSLSVGFILEEGLPLEVLRRIVASMKAAAEEVGVRIVTGDTKVVDRGKGDGLYVNTAGVGIVPAGLEVHPNEVQPGDRVLISGDLGRHGVAVLSVREGLAFEEPVESDCGDLSHLVAGLLEAGLVPHCLRDLTRGGLASALNEIAGERGVGIEVEEASIPVSDAVRGACEVLGLDPLYVANEGRLVAFVKPEQAEDALQLLRGLPGGEGATLVGTVLEEGKGRVHLRGVFGANRLLDLLSGEQLPRIC